MEGFRELLGTIRRLRTMKKLRKLFLACFLTCSSFITAPAQTSMTLKTGTSIERDLGPGQSHVFTVEAEANSFVRLVVDQKGIDVIITVTAPLETAARTKNPWSRCWRLRMQVRF